MAMTKVLSIGIVAIGAATLVGCGAPPKILVGHGFVNSEKSAKAMLQDSGEVVDKTRLFHVWVRMCDVKADATEVNCKDTRVLENVIPASVY